MSLKRYKKLADNRVQMQIIYQDDQGDPVVVDGNDLVDESKSRDVGQEYIDQMRAISDRKLADWEGRDGVQYRLDCIAEAEAEIADLEDLQAEMDQEL